MCSRGLALGQRRIRCAPPHCSRRKCGHLFGFSLHAAAAGTAFWHTADRHSNVHRTTEMWKKIKGATWQIYNISDGKYALYANYILLVFKSVCNFIWLHFIRTSWSSIYKLVILDVHHKMVVTADLNFMTKKNTQLKTQFKKNINCHLIFRSVRVLRRHFKYEPISHQTQYAIVQIFCRPK